MADRLSAPLTEDVARKARRAKGSPSDYPTYHISDRPTRISWPVKTRAGAEREATVKNSNPSTTRQPERRRRRSRYEDATGISSSSRKSPALRGKRASRRRSLSPVGEAV